jgi:hypothetical protein
VYARDFKNAYSYISARDRRLKDEATYVRERGSFQGFVSEVARQLAGYVAVSVLEQRIVRPRAYVKLDVRAPDPEKTGPLVRGWDADGLEKLTVIERKELLGKLETMRRERALPLYQAAENFELVNETGQWKVFLNWAAGKQVSFQTTLSPGLSVEARVKQAQVAARSGENFTVSLLIKNTGKQDVLTRVGHLVDPFEFRDYLDLIECGFLYPIRLPAGREEEFTATYRIRDSIPESVRQLSVTYAFSPAK